MPSERVDTIVQHTTNVSLSCPRNPLASGFRGLGCSYLVKSPYNLVRHETGKVLKQAYLESGGAGTNGDHEGLVGTHPLSWMPLTTLGL